MKDWFKWDISHTEAIWSITVGILVFAFFRFLGKRLVKINKFKWFSRFLPAFEGVAWLLYLGWVVHQVGGGSLDYLASLAFILLVIAFVSWFALRDFVAGIITKFDGLYTIGDRVSIGSIKGVITKMGFRTLRVKLPNGEVANIPYSHISSQVHAKQAQSHLSHLRKYHITIKSTLPLETLLQDLKKALYDAPWWVPSQVPAIEVAQWNNGQADFHVQIHALQQEDFLKILHYAGSRLGGIEIHPSN